MIEYTDLTLTYQALDDLDVEISGESIRSPPPEPMPRVEPALHTSGMTVAMAFARVQIFNQQEELAKNPSQGFIVPRLRPKNTSGNAVDQHSVDTNVNFNIGQPLVDPQIRARDNNFPSGSVQKSFGNQQNTNRKAAGDFNVDMPLFTNADTEFPLFKNGGPYTLHSASLNQPCMEYRNTGTLCYSPATYPCEEGHSNMPFKPHPVCHDCRLQPDKYDVGAEEEIIANHRIYFCAECTEERATGPAVQMWAHPRRYGELKALRVNTCSCHDELQKKWICKHHRILKLKFIQKWGLEHLKSFKVFFAGNYCACCRVKPPQIDGPKVMWQCAYCKDIVVLEPEEIW
jgi:hypothetical protein